MIQPIGDLFGNSLSKYGIGRESAAAFVCLRYNEVMREVCGERATGYAQALKYERGEIVVEVRSSVWASQLHLQQTQLLEKLRTKLPPACAVSRVRYVMAGADEGEGSSGQFPL